MASQTILAAINSTTQISFDLASTTSDGARYMKAGRPLSCPFVVEIKRKLNPNGSGNDHVGLRVARTEQNLTTGKLATDQVLVDVSLSKDQSILTPTVKLEILAIVASLLNDGENTVGTTTNRSAVIEGRDL